MKDIIQSSGKRKAASVNMNPSLMAHSMTLHDWFAGQALSRIANKHTTQDAATWAYAYADAMIAARKVKP
jgi:hypothetical protein